MDMVVSSRRGLDPPSEDRGSTDPLFWKASLGHHPASNPSLRWLALRGALGAGGLSSGLGRPSGRPREHRWSTGAEGFDGDQHHVDNMFTYIIPLSLSLSLFFFLSFSLSLSLFFFLSFSLSLYVVGVCRFLYILSLSLSLPPSTLMCFRAFFVAAFTFEESFELQFLSAARSGLLSCQRSYAPQLKKSWLVQMGESSSQVRKDISDLSDLSTWSHVDIRASVFLQLRILGKLVFL